MDDREKTEALVEKYKLSFEVAYGADARAVSAVTGAIVNDDPVYLWTTASSSEGRIVTAVCSAVWVWSATSNLRQSTEEQRQISGEVDEWRNRF
ncbi:hypothetical protein [Bradyrhizobium sp. AS23.2]|uniref:hypothetical protein n=1 Tax=Bradyrhizobium sp. AS23.2 TaxID=1680155 RepID=UPI00093D4C66|nr:hypothetical protein [Bradyrhizobium sp. AS23.2]